VLTACLSRDARALVGLCALTAALTASRAAGPPVRARVDPAAVAQSSADARIWIGRAAEIENYLRTVPIVSMEALSVGVTKPMKATLPPGGPVPYLVWKPIRPGIYQGSWESYKSEIAAYELDKLLALDMVPPTVEKTHRGERGAAIMWASPTRSFKDFGGTGAPAPPAAESARFTRQLVRAKMFDNLIRNIDPNLGNWLVDPAWNVMLIDHSRCFTGGRDFVHEMTRVDAELWARMQALTEESLRPVLGPWMGAGEVRAVLRRRDRMQELIDRLVKERGETAVFIR